MEFKPKMRILALLCVISGVIQGSTLYDSNPYPFRSDSTGDHKHRHIRHKHKKKHHRRTALESKRYRTVLKNKSAKMHTVVQPAGVVTQTATQPVSINPVAEDLT